MGNILAKNSIKDEKVKQPKFSAQNEQQIPTSTTHQLQLTQNVVKSINSPLEIDDSMILQDLRGGFRFHKFTLVKTETIALGEPTDAYTKVQQLTFALKSPNHYIDFGQPTNYLRVRLPGTKFTCRAYSLTNDLYQKGFFQITIKCYKGGLLSTYLGNLKVGDQVEANKPQQRTLMPSKYVGLLAFGIGITEMIHTIGILLREGRKVRLVYSLRFKREILFKEKLDKYMQDYKDDFDLIYLFSQEDESQEIKDFLGVQKIFFRKRVGEETLQIMFSDWKGTDARFYGIGTFDMVVESYKTLKRLGFLNYLVIWKPKFTIWF